MAVTGATSGIDVADAGSSVDEAVMSRRFAVRTHGCGYQARGGPVAGGGGAARPRPMLTGDARLGRQVSTTGFGIGRTGVVGASSAIARAENVQGWSFGP